jgi:predicted permease
MNIFRSAIRHLVTRRGFSAAAMITLAIGIGANTMVFSVLSGIYLRPLPFEGHEELVELSVQGKTRDIQKLSVPQFSFLREHAKTLKQIAAIQARDFTLTAVNEPIVVQSALASVGLFELLRTPALLGRTFNSSEHEYGANHVAVISDALWRRSFAASTSIVGTSIRLNTEIYQIIGVLPPGFEVPVEGGNAALWIPMTISSTVLQSSHQALAVIGRLDGEEVILKAREEIKLLDHAFRQENQTSPDLGNLQLTGLTRRIDHGNWLFLVMLSCGAALLLMIGCANVVSLSLSHGLARRKEVAIRLSLGSGRWRVIQQLLAEGIILTAGGGLIGLMFAIVSTRFISNWMRDEFAFDGKVLLFSFAISLATGIICGLFPAFFVCRVSLSEALKDSHGDQREAMGPFRLRQMFVLIQVTMSVCLLLGTGLMVRSLLKFVTMNTGFNPKGILAVQIPILPEKYTTDSLRIGFFERIIREASFLPGVQVVTATSGFPIYAPTFLREFRVVGEGEASDVRTFVDINRAAASYLATMEITLLQGRHFTEEDRDGSEGVAIIDRNMKERFFRDRDPIGKVLSITTEAGTQKPFTIIGVADYVINVGNRYELDRPRPIVYVPYQQWPATTMTVLVKTHAEPLAVAPAVKALIRRADPEVPIQDIRTLEARMAAAGDRNNQMLVMMGVFGLCGLFLAGLGLFAVVSFGVKQRTREIGIRMALGAREADVQSHFLKQGLLLGLCGVSTGIGCALAMTRQMESLLYGVSPNDLFTYIAVSLFVLLVTLVACYCPARRASLIDPLRALRHE